MPTLFEGPHEIRINDTIFALASGAAPAAVAIIRVSGSAVNHISNTMLDVAPTERVATLCHIMHPADGTLLDQAIVLRFRAPASYTGEDVLELQCHGSHAVIQAILRALHQIPHCRPAQPGEFTRRALLKGRMNLLQVEALADLIDAQSQTQRIMAQRQGRSGNYETLASHQAAIDMARARVEAYIDFEDDEIDVPHDLMAQLDEEIRAIRHALLQTLTQTRQSGIIVHGIRIAIIGAPNVGKSSLLNAIAQQELAIVTEYAGTTRDVIHFPMDIAGYRIIFQDTAGLRDASDPVEKIGISRAKDAREQAHLVWHLTDNVSQPLGTDGASWQVPQWRIGTKADLFTGKPELSAQFDHHVSALTGKGMPKLMQALQAWLIESYPLPQEIALTGQRHEAVLRQALTALCMCGDGIATGEPHEILAQHLQSASHALGQLLGQTHIESILDEIFSRYCIGK